ENLVTFLFMAPFSQELEPPQNPGRFKGVRHHPARTSARHSRCTPELRAVTQRQAADHYCLETKSGRQLANILLEYSQRALAYFSRALEGTTKNKSSIHIQ
ncbi:hypothetical protein DF035_35120, partial [Burkholderia contaminans]